MARAAIKLPFFLDNNVPDSIGKYLQHRGHSVFRLRHHMSPDSPDPIVASTAMAAGRILVTQDKDFNSQRFQQPRFARLSRIALCGPSHTLLPAVKEHIEMIEFAWIQCVAKREPRMVVHIQLGQFRSRK